MLHNNKSQFKFLLVFLSIVLLLQFGNCDQPNNFDYDQNGDNWSGDCVNNGTKQSPIELSQQDITATVPDSYLFADFHQTNATVYFYNTTIYLNTTQSFGEIYTKLIDGNSVPLKATEIRIRVHAEHKIQESEKYHDLQLQIFHTELYLTTRNIRFAIALFYQISTSGKTDPFIQTIIDAYEAKSSTNTQENEEIKSKQIPSISLKHLFQDKNMIDNFWYYSGSPTFPTCRNGQVNWIVYQKVYELSQEQYDKIVKILMQGKSESQWKGNWRKIQPKNGNIVGFRNIQAEL